MLIRGAKNNYSRHYEPKLEEHAAMITHADFETPITDLYYRNNRSSKQKSLRLVRPINSLTHLLV